MKNISKAEKLSMRDVYYYRSRLQNNIYHDILERFVELAENEGLTKKQIASAIGKDEGQICRLFSKPGNWTLSTISDLLLSMGAELSHEVVQINEQVESRIGTTSSHNVVHFERLETPEPATERYYVTS